MMLQTDIDMLFREWQARPHHIGSVFNRDGIVDIAEWEKQDCRIMFLLKEAYHDKSFAENVYDLAEDIRQYAPWGNMWRRVAEWTRGLLLTAQGENVSYHELSDEDARNYLRTTAVVNIKKSHGKPRSDEDDLRTYAERDADLLYRQIEMISPTVIVCCSTFSLLNVVIGKYETPIDKAGVNHSDNWHYKWKSRIVLDYYHPAIQVSPLMTFYGIAGCYQDYLSTEKSSV